MIHIFRKEMKKWSSIWWIVLAALGIQYFVARTPRPREVAVAKVDGASITAGDFQRLFAQEQFRREFFSMYFGIPITTPINSRDIIRQAAQEKLLDATTNHFNIAVDREYYKGELVKNLPQGVFDNGGLNIEAYNRYLQRLHMSIAEFEGTRLKEIERSLVTDLVKNSAYTPEFSLLEEYLHEKVARSFVMVKLPFERFVEKAKEREVSDEAAQAYYQSHQEKYRVAEKIKLRYGIISPASVEKRIAIDDDAIETFYQKNKSEQFMIPAKVSVRQIMLKKPENEADVATVREQIVSYKDEATNDPAVFADLARKYSQDTSSASKGGFMGFLKRGEQTPEFERAAFRLKNKDEISSVIETPKAFHIIMLEQRIDAQEKPLDSVRELIVATLKKKKAAVQVRSALESLRHQASGSPEAFEAFIQENGMETTTTDWVSVDQTTAKNNAESEVAKILAKIRERKRQGAKSLGYFADGENFVVYQVSDSQESYIPSFEQARATVIRDLVNEEATKMLKKEVREAKTHLLRGDKDLMTYAQETGFPLEKTEKMILQELTGPFKGKEALAQRAWYLSDKNQVLKARDGRSYYLIQLNFLDKIDSEKYNTWKSAGLLSAQRSAADAALEAFIASLERNAKITINERALPSQSANTPY